MNGVSSFLTGLKIIGQVSDWSEKALEDGKVTLKEAVDLAQKVGSALGVRLELDIPGVVIVPEEGTLEKTVADLIPEQLPKRPPTDDD